MGEHGIVGMLWETFQVCTRSGDSVGHGYDLWVIVWQVSPAIAAYEQAAAVW